MNSLLIRRQQTVQHRLARRHAGAVSATLQALGDVLRQRGEAGNLVGPERAAARCPVNAMRAGARNSSASPALI